MLSTKERELVLNTDWILTKNAVIQKVYDLFGGLSLEYQDLLTNHHFSLPPEAQKHFPKISKGEQYEGLPWVMLDYPRYYTKSDSFGIRSFFWWGNFCSITIQLSGIHQQNYFESIQNYFMINGIASAKCKDWFIGINDDPWLHNFEKNNFQPISEKLLKAMPDMRYIKLAKKIPLQQWDGVTNFFEQNFLGIISMLANQKS